MNILRIVDGKVYTFKLTNMEMRWAYDEQRFNWDKDEILHIARAEASDFPEDEEAKEMYEALNNNEELLSMVAHNYRNAVDYCEYDDDVEFVRKAYGQTISQIEEANV